ncbi:S8 family peptidase [Phaeocystidibacter luteus]|uniref:S8 family serine peptidase n=1 Tax=Phaeocystidibacter luteus TaxID=911197 RepID=A0A6N6RFD4_9FLAO|nr:S8 family peptidase [Phaeocystidibacter luteus]KAB2809871.1 S8 family serine peptidase [Phaeocystidibacter luteus]
MKSLASLALVILSLTAFGQSNQLMFVAESTGHGIPEHLSQLVQNHSGEFVKQFPRGKGSTEFVYVVRFPEANIDAAFQDLSNSSPSLLVEYDHVLKADTTKYIPNDVRFAEQWYLENDAGFNGEMDADIDMPEAWKIERGNDNVTLVIIDSGVEFDHPEFNGRRYVNPNETLNGIDDDQNGKIDDLYGWDFVDNDNDPNDENGHGTAVAGVAAANGDDLRGWAGVDWNCRIMSVRVLSSSGSGNYSDLAEALYYVADLGVDVVNMSLGGGANSTIVEDAAEYAALADVLLIAASGNSGERGVNLPARLPTIMAVGSVNWFNDRCDPYSSGFGGSTYGDEVEIMAPGDNIPILDYQNFMNYSDVSGGTSLASPLVAGVACLLRAKHPNLGSGAIRSILHQTAIDQIGQSAEDVQGRDDYYGYGILNANEALKYEPIIITSDDDDLFQIAIDFDNRDVLYEIEEDAQKIEIFDVSGRRIFVATNVRAGTHRVNISSAGVYSIRATINYARHNRQAVIY